jgi:hypothetical protein
MFLFIAPFEYAFPCQCIPKTLKEEVADADLVLLARVQSENDSQVFLKPLKIFKGPAQDIVAIDKDIKTVDNTLSFTTDCERDWNSFWKESREENRIVLVFTRKDANMRYRISGVCNPTTNAFERNDPTLIELGLTKDEFKKFGLPTDESVFNEFFTAWKHYKTKVLECNDVDCFKKLQKVDRNDESTNKYYQGEFKLEKEIYSDPEIIKNNVPIEKYLPNPYRLVFYLKLSKPVQFQYTDYPYPIVALAISHSYTGEKSSQDAKISIQEKWSNPQIRLLSGQEWQDLIMPLGDNTSLARRAKSVQEKVADSDVVALVELQSQDDQHVFLKPIRVFKTPDHAVFVVNKKESKQNISPSKDNPPWGDFWKTIKMGEKILLFANEDKDKRYLVVSRHPPQIYFQPEDPVLIELGLSLEEFEKFGLPTYKPMADEFSAEWQTYKKAITQCPNIDYFMKSIEDEKTVGSWKDKLESGAWRVKFEYEKRLYSEPEMINNDFILENHAFNSPGPNVFLFFRLKKPIGYFEHPPVLVVSRGRYDYDNYSKMSAQKKWGEQYVKLISEEEYQHILPGLKRNTDQ